MENDNYKAELEKLYEKLLSVLTEKDMPTLRKIKLSHLQREKELSMLSIENEMHKDDLINNEKEFDDMVDQIESMTKELDQTNQKTIKLKNRISSFRKDRKEQLSKRRGLAVSKGRLGSKHTKALEALGKIYKMCESSRSENIDYIKSRIKEICREYVICAHCKNPNYRCSCE